MENVLYYGDNLNILREYIKDESVDLIYLDPPFNSNQNYNVIFDEEDGSSSNAQIQVFTDTWHWNKISEDLLRDISENENTPSKVIELLEGLEIFLGKNQLYTYLVMMAPRLLELYRVLKPSGSIYLHCDPTASHYLKLLMDAIFDIKYFQREIIWSIETSSGFKSRANNWIRGHDSILFYSKKEISIFNKQFFDLSEKTIKRYDKVDENGKRFKIYYDKDRLERKVYLDTSKGRPMTDVWSDIIGFQTVNNTGEYLNYPTQKPESLLERIIKASSNEGNIVLDPFCGCGTTITVAEKLKRKWIGIDITHLAIALMKSRLNDAFGNKVKYKIAGEPADLSGAHALAQQDRFQFEWWALSLIKARPIDNKKKGADHGIDGVIYLDITPSLEKRTSIKIVVQVKSGHVSVKDIKEFRTTIDNSKSKMGIFITLNEPTSPMVKECLEAGLYKPNIIGARDCPVVQILTIEELLNNKREAQLPIHDNRTFKRAERIEDDPEEQDELF